MSRRNKKRRGQGRGTQETCNHGSHKKQQQNGVGSNHNQNYPSNGATLNDSHHHHHQNVQFRGNSGHYRGGRGGSHAGSFGDWVGQDNGQNDGFTSNSNNNNSNNDCYKPNNKNHRIAKKNKFPHGPSSGAATVVANTSAGAGAGTISDALCHYQRHQQQLQRSSSSSSSSFSSFCCGHFITDPEHQSLHDKVRTVLADGLDARRALERFEAAVHDCLHVDANLMDWEHQCGSPGDNSNAYDIVGGSGGGSDNGVGIDADGSFLVGADPPAATDATVSLEAYFAELAARVAPLVGERLNGIIAELVATVNSGGGVAAGDGSYHGGGGDGGSGIKTLANGDDAGTFGCHRHFSHHQLQQHPPSATFTASLPLRHHHIGSQPPCGDSSSRTAEPVTRRQTQQGETANGRMQSATSGDSDIVLGDVGTPRRPISSSSNSSIGVSAAAAAAAAAPAVNTATPVPVERASEAIVGLPDGVKKIMHHDLNGEVKLATS